MAKFRIGGLAGPDPILLAIILPFVMALLAAAWFPSPALALEGPGPEKKEVVSSEHGNIWVGLGYLAGDVTYQIGGKFKETTPRSPQYGKLQFPISELKWPLDLLMFTVGGELRFLKKGELRIAFSKNLTDQPGKLEDTDWETDRSRPHRKTDFSTSDTTFSGYVLDLGLRYWLLEKKVNPDFAWALAPGLGLVYQEFSWDGRDVVQDYLDTKERIMIAGPTITYKFNLLMPLLEVAGKLAYKRLSLLASFGYSPKLIAKDKDIHILRSKFVTTKAYGHGFRTGLQCRFNLSRHWFLHLSGDWLRLEARDMDQNWLNGSTWRIEHEITSTQLSMRGGVGFQF